MLEERCGSLLSDGEVQQSWNTNFISGDIFSYHTINHRLILTMGFCWIGFDTENVELRKEVFSRCHNNIMEYIVQSQGVISINFLIKLNKN